MAKSRLIGSTLLFYFLIAFTTVLQGQTKTPKVREWLGNDGSPIATGQLVGGDDSSITVLTENKAEVSILFDELSKKDSKHAKTMLGLSRVDLTGVWRSQTNTYYVFVDNGDKIYVNFLESPHLVSIDASLRRVDNKVIADQWLVVYEADPQKRSIPHRGIFEFYKDKDQMRCRGEDVRHTKDWKRISKKKKTLKFLRLDFDQIPDHIIKKYFPEPEFRTVEERRKDGIKALMAIAIADKFAKSLETQGSVTKSITYALIIVGRDKMIRNACKDLLPRSSERQQRELFELIRFCMDQPNLEELTIEQLKEFVKGKISEKAASLKNIEGITEIIFDAVDAYHQQ